MGKERADEIATALSQSGNGSASSFADCTGERAKELFEAVQLDYALATRSVFYVMAGVLAVAFVVTLLALPAGRVEEVIEGP